MIVLCLLLLVQVFLSFICMSAICCIFPSATTTCFCNLLNTPSCWKYALYSRDIIYFAKYCCFFSSLSHICTHNQYCAHVGKSLCFQLPALITGKIVVVVSPLISLMRDQCLQLARQGVSACFLGSGQTDKSIELKAMAGMYSIVYICPETLLR